MLDLISLIHDCYNQIDFQSYFAEFLFIFVLLYFSYQCFLKVILAFLLYLSLSDFFFLLVVYLMLYFSYLELAILPCWRFLVDKPEDSVQRLVMMTRGLADPLASAYCSLYMAHCAQKLPSRDIGTHFVYFSFYKYILYT
jgi:hypothetical protein